MIPACMGGFCHVRNRCERHTTDKREHVAERLCARGEEGAYRLISFRPIGDWERTVAPSMLRAPSPFDGVFA